MKGNGLPNPDVVTTYHYDTDPDVTPIDRYGSRNNRLMYFEVHQGQAHLETTWYAYNRGGQVKRIVTQYPSDPQTPDVKLSQSRFS